MLALLAALPGIGHAGSVERIAAIVNDEIVSGYDIEQRIDLVLATTNLQHPEETRRRLRHQVLRTLIDERLQMQEARKLNLKVTDEDLQRAYRYLERQNNIPQGQLDEYLKREGVSIEALKPQLKAEIAWSKVVRSRLQPTVRIGNDEVEEVLSRLRANAGKIGHQIAEIYLPVDSPPQEDDVHASAQKLVDQLRGGADFAAMARQFSAGTTAAAGGAVGWVQPGQLADELESALSKMAVGEISDPVRAAGGFYILKLLDKRRIAAADPMDTKLALKQLILPAASDTGGGDAQVQQATASVNGCAQVEDAAKQIQNAQYADLGTLRLGDMPQEIQSAVRDLDVGKFSRPIRQEGRVILLMVCKRVEPPSPLPSRQEIETRLTDQRLSMLAQRYMRDLRRNAVVELR